MTLSLRMMLWVHLTYALTAATIAAAQVSDATGTLAPARQGDLVYYQMPCEFADMQAESFYLGPPTPFTLAKPQNSFTTFIQQMLVTDQAQMTSALRGGIAGAAFAQIVTRLPGVFAFGQSGYLSVAGHPGYYQVGTSDTAHKDSGIRWCKYGALSDPQVKSLDLDDEGKCQTLWSQISKSAAGGASAICPHQWSPVEPRHDKGDWAKPGYKLMPYNFMPANGFCFASCPDIATNVSDMNRRIDDLTANIQHRLDALEKTLASGPAVAPTTGEVSAQKPTQ